MQVGDLGPGSLTEVAAEGQKIRGRTIDALVVESTTPGWQGCQPLPLHPSTPPYDVGAPGGLAGHPWINHLVHYYYLHSKAYIHT